MPSKKIRTEHCKNCNYDFRIDLPHMKYCPNCGQENHSPRMPFFHYLYELIEGFLHLDNKTWLTIKTLFLHPGKITKDFIEDKRKRYSPPVRMLIWSTTFQMFCWWLLIDFTSHASEPASEAVKSMSQRFDEMPDSSGISINIIGFFWPTLPSTPVSKLRALKKIPDHEIKGWLQQQQYPADFFHVQLIKAFRSQVNSPLNLSAYTKKITTGSSLLFVLSIPLLALFLFPFLYRKKTFYYDSLVFTMHINTWAPLFLSVWIWVLWLIGYFLHAPSAVSLSVPVLIAVYYFFALKAAFGFSWMGTIIRWLPAFVIDSLFHWILLLLFAAWFMN